MLELSTSFARMALNWKQFVNEWAAFLKFLSDGKQTNQEKIISQSTS